MKTTRITNTNYLRTGYGENDITPQSFLEAEIITDGQGRIVKESHYLPEEGLDSVTVNEYDEGGRIVSSSQYDFADELIQRNTFTYENGRLVRKGCFYGEGSPEYATVYVYEGENLVREDSYNEDEFDYTEKKHVFNDANQEVKRDEFNDDGEIIYHTENEYNAEGFLSRRLREEPMEHDSRTYTFEYDEAGRKTKELVYNFDEKLIAKTYYVYNEAGDVVETEEENLDIYRRTQYTYDGSNCVKVEQFDRDDLFSWTEYTYNEQGDVTFIKSYVHDEVDPEKYRVVASVQYDIEY